MSVHSISSQNLQDKEVQTVVKVYPFILPSSVPRASVTSDKKFCTVLSLETSIDSSKFYNLLQYCPYQDIEDHNVRVLNLPRKTKLQWVTDTQLSEQGLHKTTLADDDGVAEVCQDLLLRLRSGKKTTLSDADTQTDLLVRPHLLEEPKVAVIYRTVSVQVVLLPKCRPNPHKVLAKIKDQERLYPLRCNSCHVGSSRIERKLQSNNKEFTVIQTATDFN